MRLRTHATLFATLLGGVACQLPNAGTPALFVAGRAVATAGDSMFAAALTDTAGVIRFFPSGDIHDTIGLGTLAAPRTVQWVAGGWYVSDVINGAPAVHRFDATGALEQTVLLKGRTTLRHQFAPLTDGRIVVEAPDGRLIALDSTGSGETFATTEQSPRPSMLLAAEDGVVHAVPDQTITLYNRFGRIRWRIEWPWVATAHVSELAVDGRGRIHVLSGVANESTFIVYTLEPATGEVIRWSESEPQASFVVDRWGEVTLDETERW